MNCNIRCNYIMSVDKKCEVCNYTLIMKLHDYYSKSIIL